MSGEPLFLTLDEVLQIHAEMIASFGGRDGVRDMALLESAIAQPSGRFGGAYLYDGFAQMAAAYLFGIAKNHAFIDGNKRTAAAAAIVFLKMNGVGFSCSNDELAAITEDVASGSKSREELVEFFRGHSDVAG
jgi:death-on-curing protein